MEVDDRTEHINKNDTLKETQTNRRISATHVDCFPGYFLTLLRHRRWHFDSLVKSQRILSDLSLHCGLFSCWPLWQLPVTEKLIVLFIPRICSRESSWIHHWLHFPSAALTALLIHSTLTSHMGQSSCRPPKPRVERNECIF